MIVGYHSGTEIFMRAGVRPLCRPSGHTFQRMGGVCLFVFVKNQEKNKETES